jgi:hypothetical protein
LTTAIPNPLTATQDCEGRGPCQSSRPCWRSAGRMPKRASMERPEGRMPEGSVRRDGMGLTPSLRKRPAAMVRRPGACSSPSDFASTLRIGVANCVLRKAPRFLRVPPAGSSASEGSGTSVRRDGMDLTPPMDREGRGLCQSSRPCWRSAGRMPKRASMERPEGRMPEGSVRRDGIGLTPSLRAQGPPSPRERPAGLLGRQNAFSCDPRNVT